MSTFFWVTCKCGVCKTKFQVEEMASSFSYGSSDLDMRPPLMGRALMSYWIHVCPKCGYVHSDIRRRARRHSKYIKSNEYLTCQGNSFADELTVSFYRYALILLREKKAEEAFFAFLHAAWAADDSHDKVGSVLCRNKALSLYDQFPKSNPEELHLMRADILRRAGHFDEVIDQYTGFKSDNPEHEKIVQFQIDRAKAYDDTGYAIDDCDCVIMTLYDEPFSWISSGKKTVEVRCNDEKRQEIKVGDNILFIRASNPSERVYTTVVKKQKFETFEELYSSFPIDVFGPAVTKQDLLQQINEIYSQEKQSKYGALAISIRRKNQDASWWEEDIQSPVQPDGLISLLEKPDAE